MPRQLALFLTALQFLTRVPTPRLDGFEPEWTARSARYFPLVGALVGAAAALVLAAAAQFWSGVLPALLAVGAAVLLTGAFHEDGLADTFDGLGGGLDRQRKLEIMKDSRVGTYGALALVLVIVAKVLALGQLPLAIAAATLVASHASARAAAVAVMRLHPYAGDREWAKVKPVADGVFRSEAIAAVGFGLVAVLPLIMLAPMTAIAGLGAGMIAAAGVAIWARRSLGGWVGDTLGATEQAFEGAFLLAVAAVLA